jgi:hypothetical protein
MRYHVLLIKFMLFSQVDGLCLRRFICAFGTCPEVWHANVVESENCDDADYCASEAEGEADSIACVD